MSGSTAAQVLQGLNWQRLMPGLGKAAQLRLGLALLAAHKGAGAGDSAYGDWLWRLLEGPAGAALSCCTTGSASSRRSSDPPEVLMLPADPCNSFPTWGCNSLCLRCCGMHGRMRGRMQGGRPAKSADVAHAPPLLHLTETVLQLQGQQARDTSASEAHVLCMTEAPGSGSEEVRALWAWLRASLALGLLESWAGSESAQASGPAWLKHFQFTLWFCCMLRLTLLLTAHDPSFARTCCAGREV